MVAVATETGRRQEQFSSCSSCWSSFVAPSSVRDHTFRQGYDRRPHTSAFPLRRRFAAGSQGTVFLLFREKWIKSMEGVLPPAFTRLTEAGQIQESFSPAASIHTTMAVWPGWYKVFQAMYRPRMAASRERMAATTASLSSVWSASAIVFGMVVVGAE